MVSIRPKTKVQIKAEARCPTHAKSEISMRDLVQIIDEPTERGGTNEGPSPTETALGALIGCTNVIGHKCAKSLGIDIGHLNISASCDFDRRGVLLTEEIETPFTHIHLRIEADGPASQNDLQKVSKEVAKFCPLAKLYRNAGTTIEEEWIAVGNS